MDCLTFHVDLIDSGGLLRSINPRADRDRFCACCENVLRLLLARLLDSRRAQVVFAGDGGFCLLPVVDSPKHHIDDLLQIASVYPDYVNYMARPPILEQNLPWPARFRRGISWITDVSESFDRRPQTLGNPILGEALKHERLWISGDHRKITVWKEAFLSANAVLWNSEVRTASIGQGLEWEVYDVEAPAARSQTDADEILSRMVALEYASIYSLRDAVRNGESVETALPKVFEPQNYLRETLTAIKSYVEKVVGCGQKIRVALFLANGAKEQFELCASAARSAHKAESIPFSRDSAARRAYQSQSPQIIPNAEEVPHFFFTVEQREIIKSHLSIPVRETNLSITSGQLLPQPQEARWGDVMAVVCIDSNLKNAFALQARDGGEAFMSTLQPLLRDLEEGLLIGYLKGTSSE